mmetsp:Transcript_8798/g.14801  ORF Transcript_8798/g.14801 Transcript_8798/m.14801 type:complete len:83 (-) Transcript_8798:113-361(-)
MSRLLKLAVCLFTCLTTEKSCWDILGSFGVVVGLFQNVQSKPLQLMAMLSSGVMVLFSVMTLHLVLTNKCCFFLVVLTVFFL